MLARRISGWHAPGLDSSVCAPWNHACSLMLWGLAMQNRRVGRFYGWWWRSLEQTLSFHGVLHPPFPLLPLFAPTSPYVAHQYGPRLRTGRRCRRNAAQQNVGGHTTLSHRHALDPHSIQKAASYPSARCSSQPAIHRGESTLQDIAPQKANMLGTDALAARQQHFDRLFLMCLCAPKACFFTPSLPSPPLPPPRQQPCVHPCAPLA